VTRVSELELALVFVIFVVVVEGLAQEILPWRRTRQLKSIFMM